MKKNCKKVKRKYQKKTNSGLSIGEVIHNIGKLMTQKDHNSKKSYNRKLYKLKLRKLLNGND